MMGLSRAMKAGSTGTGENERGQRQKEGHTGCGTLKDVG